MKWVTLFDMSPAEMIGAIVGALAILVIYLVWRGARANEDASWPVTEGTIQSVGRVNVSCGRGSSYSIEVGDFSYKVSDEYYSGRVTVVPSVGNGDRSTRELVHQTLPVRYNPARPEKFVVAQTDVAGFVLGPYSDSFSQNQDLDPIDLNIDNI